MFATNGDLVNNRSILDKERRAQSGNFCVNQIKHIKYYWEKKDLPAPSLIIMDLSLTEKTKQAKLC